MTTYLLIFLAALLLATLATPLARRLALRLGVVDTPSQRKIHRQPVPMLGGVALYVAFIVALAVFGGSFNLPQLASILLGATVVSFLGIWDDTRGMRPLLKLLIQALAAVVLILSGIQVQLVGLEWANYAITILWVVGITNALNLLDNMDGLSGGVAAVAAAFFLLLAALSHQFLVAALSAALLGACLGFLRYNLNPASIFMGDSGSLFLGFVLAAIGIKLHFENIITVTWMIPVVVLGLPIFDTALVVISRLRRGLNPLTNPGRDHTSHRLVALGLSRLEAVLTLCLGSAGLGVVATFLTSATIVEAYAVGGALMVLGGWALWRLERVDYSEHRRKSDRGAEELEPEPTLEAVAREKRKP